MSCPAVVGALLDAAVGRIDTDTEARLQRHLCRCDRCREVATLFDGLVQLLSVHPDPTGRRPAPVAAHSCEPASAE